MSLTTVSLFLCLVCPANFYVLSVRWDPDLKRPADIFFHQSAIIRIHAHHLRLFLHRSNLFTRQGRDFSLPICTDAARGCCSILEVYVERFDQIVPYFQASASFFFLDSVI
jgi:hypothetical protein